MVSEYTIENNRRIYTCFYCNNSITSQQICCFNPCACLIHESCKKKHFTMKYFMNCPNCDTTCKGLDSYGIIKTWKK